MSAHRAPSNARGRRCFPRALRAGRCSRACCCCSSRCSAARSICNGSTTHFLQEQGSARYSRELELPAHRGRIVDRFGDAARRSRRRSTRCGRSRQSRRGDAGASWRALRENARDDAAEARRTISTRTTITSVLARQIAPEVAARAMALKIKGLNEQNEYRRYYPGGDVTSADRRLHRRHATSGQEGIELAQQEWLGGKSGSRRVIINRRGDVVEDVAAIRAPQAGRDLALSIDSRLQYLAFRELKAAVDATSAKAGGLVIIDARSRRDSRARQLADVQPERAQPASRASGCATAR